MTTAMATAGATVVRTTAARTRSGRRDTLAAMLLVAVGRALALVLLLVVAATAAHGPLPGLSLVPASEGSAVLDHADRPVTHPVLVR
jgi:hypothetical protein